MSRKRSWLKAWVPRRLELYLSPAWKHALRPLKNMLERLEIEHLRHGGLNNGELYVSYGQFVECGISRRTIKPVLELGRQLGLIDVSYDGDTTTRNIRPPNAYRLTYVPAKGKDTPTDEWKAVTEERACALIKAFKADDKAAAKATRKEAA